MIQITWALQSKSKYTNTPLEYLVDKFNIILHKGLQEKKDLDYHLIQEKGRTLQKYFSNICNGWIIQNYFEDKIGLPLQPIGADAGYRFLNPGEISNTADYQFKHLRIEVQASNRSYPVSIKVHKIKQAEIIIDYDLQTDLWSMIITKDLEALPVHNSASVKGGKDVYILPSSPPLYTIQDINRMIGDLSFLANIDNPPQTSGKDTPTMAFETLNPPIAADRNPAKKIKEWKKNEEYIGYLVSSRETLSDSGKGIIHTFQNADKDFNPLEDQQDIWDGKGLHNGGMKNAKPGYLTKIVFIGKQKSPSSEFFFYNFEVFQDLSYCLEEVSE